MSSALSQLAGPTSMNTGGGPMPYPAPIGPVGGNALIDWIGAATNFPSFPNPYTAGNFLTGTNWQQMIGQTSPQKQQPHQHPMGITSGGSAASAPTANSQSPLLPQGMGKVGGLPNPDIGNFGTGPMPQINLRRGTGIGSSGAQLK